MHERGRTPGERTHLLTVCQCSEGLATPGCGLGGDCITPLQPVPETAWTVQARPPVPGWSCEPAVEALLLQSRQAIISLHLVRPPQPSPDVAATR
ncbi:hypothetical protein VTH82DRAFT_137 [Thermothelomyces myriococcoides]